jgi:short-subunit dehydrogenase
MGNQPAYYQNFSKNQFVPGSVVVITGASSGMGKELAYRYAARQCKVVIAARRIESLIKIKEECASKYGNFDVLPVATDVSKEDQA